MAQIRPENVSVVWRNWQGGQAITVELPQDQPLRQEDAIGLKIDAERTQVFDSRTAVNLALRAA